MDRLPDIRLAGVPAFLTALFFVLGGGLDAEPSACQVAGGHQVLNIHLPSICRKMGLESGQSRSRDCNSCGNGH